jgi:hypothetical protein
MAVACASRRIEHPGIQKKGTCRVNACGLIVRPTLIAAMKANARLWIETMKPLIGKTVEDEEYGRGVIIDQTPDNVIIALEGEGVRWLVVPVGDLENTDES